MLARMSSKLRGTILLSMAAMIPVVYAIKSFAVDGPTLDGLVPPAGIDDDPEFERVVNIPD